MRARFDQLVFDCREPARLVRFWAALLGGEPVDRGHGWSHVEVPGFPRLAFQPVPEPTKGKNRLHLDIEVGPPGIVHAADRAVGLGAIRVGAVVVDEQGSFQVMTDPEGNEFCFVSG
jgi:hypothetical protein